MTYYVCLLGAFTLWRGDPSQDCADTLPLASATARSLLAYLLLHRGRPQPRPLLAGLFWPDDPEDRARRLLTQALWRIRRCLPDMIESGGDTISISQQAPVWVDVEEFLRLSEPDQARSIPAISHSAAEEIQAIRQAVQLYRGDLLEGIYDDWILVERERLRERYLQALGRVAWLEKSAGSYREALEAILSLIQCDSLQESAHREAMRLYVALNRPEAALKQYAICRHVLQEELGVEPDAETSALAREIAGRPLLTEAPYLPQAAPAAPIAAIRRMDPIEFPLVGRDRERNVLVAQVEATMRGMGGLALVEGEAGIGKTRLLQEIARDAEWRGAQVLWGRCREMEGQPPYAVWVEALLGGLSPLRASQLSQTMDPIWLQVLARLLPVLDECLPGLSPPPAIDPAREQDRLMAALGQILAAWGQINPLVLILEDLHWADEASLALFPSLALQQCSTLVIGTYRSEEARQRPALWEQFQALDRCGLRQRLILARLDAPATGELVRRCLSLAKPAEAFEARLYRETEGNPLFVLETLQALYDDGLLICDEQGRWSTPWDETTHDYAEMPLPQAIERVISRRLERLSADEQSALQTAAILGSDFDFRLLSLASHKPAEALFPIIGSLVRRYFLVELPAAYRFSHDKIRSVIYQSLPQRQRISLHRQAGEAIETVQPERWAGMAYHFFNGEMWEKAASYSQKAGEQASAVFSHRDAADHFSRALEALGRLPHDPRRVFDLLLAREAPLGLLGDREAQAADLAALEAMLVDPSLGSPSNHLQIALRRASYWGVTGNYAESLVASSKVLEQAHTLGEWKIEAQAQIQRGHLLRHQGEMEQAKDHLQQAYVLACAHEDSALQAVSLTAMASLQFDTGHYDETLAYCQKALEACKSCDNLVAQSAAIDMMGNVYHYTADYSRAIDYHRQALALRQSLGDRRLEVMSLYNLSTALHDSGDDETSLHILQQVCDLAHRIGDRRNEGYGQVYRGLVLEYLGRYAESHEAYQISLTIRRQIGLHAQAIDTLAGLARVATAQGNLSQAVIYAQEVLDWLDGRGYQGVGDPLLAYVGAYRALLAAGETQRGHAALRRAYELLMKFAGSISDPERRRAYIEDISPGSSIWNDYRALQTTAITVRIPHVDAPTGRPLRAEEYVDVIWTAHCPEDDHIPEKAARRKAALQRLLAEAETQGAAPTVGDLASVLAVSPATVKRDLAELRQAGQPVKTRGGK